MGFTVISGPRDAGPGEREVMIDKANDVFVRAGITDHQRIDVPAHQVALKMVPREVYSGRNVERELVMLAAASHPNIVQLKDHGMTEGYVWLTMPVYEGVTLGERLKRGPLALDEAYEVFLPIARALDVSAS